MPRSSATRRSPRASRAGWTAAESAMNAPARATSVPVRAVTSLPVTRSTSFARPSRAAVATASSTIATCAGELATHSPPPRRKWQSIPFSCVKRSIRPIVALDSSASQSARSSPKRSTSPPSSSTQLVIQPPLRPLAPNPQATASSTTTLASGASAFSSSAVQRPVYPPPTTQKSALAAPANGGHATAPASAAIACSSQKTAPVFSCLGRRAVAARRVWVARLRHARLRVRVVQALEVVRVGDRDLEHLRVRVRELPGREELGQLLLPGGAAGQRRVREESVRVRVEGRRLVVAVVGDAVEQRARAVERPGRGVRHGAVAVRGLERELLRLRRPRRIGPQPDARRERLRAAGALVPVARRERLLQ